LLKRNGNEMKFIAYIIVILGVAVVIFGLVTSSPQVRSTSPGGPLPEFKVQDLSGKSVTSTELRGKVVVLDFWASWCAPCRLELPILQEISEEFTRSDVVFLAINLDLETSEDVRRFLVEESIQLPAYMDIDGAAAESFAVESLPTLIIGDKQGRTRSRHDGFAPGAFKEDVRKEIREALES